MPRRAAARTWCPGSTAHRTTLGAPGHVHPTALLTLIPHIPGPGPRSPRPPALPRGNNQLLKTPDLVPGSTPLGSRPLQVGAATPGLGGPPTPGPAGTYKVVAGAEGAVGHHSKAGRAVSCGTAVWAEAGLAHRGQGAGHLPTVQKGSGVLSLTHHRAILQAEVVGRIPITDTWRGADYPSSCNYHHHSQVPRCHFAYFLQQFSQAGITIIPLL